MVCSSSAFVSDCTFRRDSKGGTGETSPSREHEMCVTTEHSFYRHRSNSSLFDHEAIGIRSARRRSSTGEAAVTSNAKTVVRDAVIVYGLTFAAGLGMATAGILQPHISVICCQECSASPWWALASPPTERNTWHGWRQPSGPSTLRISYWDSKPAQHGYTAASPSCSWPP